MGVSVGAGCTFLLTTPTRAPISPFCPLCAAKGWAGTIRFNDRLWAQFQAFRARHNTWSLGERFPFLLPAASMACPGSMVWGGVSLGSSARAAAVALAWTPLPASNGLFAELNAAKSLHRHLQRLPADGAAGLGARHGAGRRHRAAA